MVEPTLTIVLSRTLLGLDPLAFSARLDGTPLGILQFQPPATQSRNTYMPDSGDVVGSELLASTEQQAILGWDWVREIGSTETQVQASRLEVRAAIRQFTFTVTTQISGAPAEVWTADPGTQVASARDYSNLANRNPVYAVTIPVYPIAS